MTPPDFCLLDMARRRRVENCVSHSYWPENGGVLKGSGRGGLQVKTLDETIAILEEATSIPVSHILGIEKL